MQIDKSDRKWMLALFAGVVLLTTVPYFIAFANQGSQWVFSGFFMGVDDGNSYLAKMVSGMNGSWLFRTPYTTQPQAGIIAFLPYLLLGKLIHSPGLHIQLIMVFQIFRMVGIGVYILGVYQFISIFTSNRMIRSIGMVFITFGGGLGWLFPILGIKQLFGTIPLDFYSPETFGFLDLYSFPHLAFARGLVFMGLSVFISGWNTSELPVKILKRLWPGILLFIAGIFQPLSTAIGLVLIVIFTIADQITHEFSKESLRNHIIQLIFPVLPALPVILYNGIAQFTDPFFKAWTEQNIITSPHPAHYLLAFAIPLIIIAIHFNTLRSLVTQAKFLFLILWIPVFLLLAYIPFNLQRRLPDGIFIAIIILMMCLIENSGFRYVRQWLVVAGFMILPSTLLIISNGILSATHPFEPIFIAKDRAEAYIQMSQVVKHGSNVLANFQTGNEFPVWAPVFMAMGHGPESIHLDSVREDVNKFFNMESNDETRKDILEKYKIDFVIQEKTKDTFPSLSEKTPCYLQLDLDTDIYGLYKVVTCE
jgi:hypothetical protein